MTNLTKYGLLLILSVAISACGGSDNKKSSSSSSEAASSEAASSEAASSEAASSEAASSEAASSEAASSEAASSEAASSEAASSEAASSEASSSSSVPSVDARICFDKRDTILKDTVTTTSAFTAAKIYWFNGLAEEIDPISLGAGWPGRDMTANGDFFCYDFTDDLVGDAMLTSLTVIFNNGNGGDSNQTADLPFTSANGACYQNNAWTTLEACGVAEESSSSASSEASSSEASSSEASSSSSAPSIDARICFDKRDTILKDTVTTTSAFTAAKIYWFNGLAEEIDPISLGAGWPGRDMTANGDFFCYDFTDDLVGDAMLTSLTVIFNNGNGGDSNQTADLPFTSANSACYQNNAWTTIEACGVDSQD